MIPCPKCKSEITPLPPDRWTKCANCGRAWELNEELTAVKSVMVIIDNLTIKTNSKKR